MTDVVENSLSLMLYDGGALEGGIKPCVSLIAFVADRKLLVEGGCLNPA